jgi:hypothetical protein
MQILWLQNFVQQYPYIAIGIILAITFFISGILTNGTGRYNK